MTYCESRVQEQEDTMATETLLDELLSIACGSVDADEVESRFARFVQGHLADRAEVAAEVRRSIRLLRIKAKAMESQVGLTASRLELDRMNLTEWAAETRTRAADLRRDADELERIAIAAGVIERIERPASLYGIWKGAEVTEDDIEEAKRAWMKAVTRPASSEYGARDGDSDN